MPRLLYTLALLLLLPYLLLRLLWRSRSQPEYLRHLGERFGCYAAPASGSGAGDGGLIWIHAVSVGETRAAQPLIAALMERYPSRRILLTQMTPTGRQAASELFGSDVLLAYLPYDYPFSVKRFLSRFRPVMGIVMETEIWPNLFAACRTADMPLLLANARLSARSAQGYARLPGLARAALECVSAVAAQSEEDAARLRTLGANCVKVTGNVKFDILPPSGLLLLGETLRGRIGPRPVLLAASTREGEEALLLAALARRPLGAALLIIVPRHPQRFDEVAAMAGKAGFRLQRRSEDRPVAAETQVLLGDSMGEMFAYYAACDVAFIGGSLLEYGCQNLIEACAVGKPVLIGPSTFNFAAAAEAALAAGAALQATNADALIDAASRLLENPQERALAGEAGRQFAARHRGATERTLEMIASMMPPAGPAGSIETH